MIEDRLADRSGILYVQPASLDATAWYLTRMSCHRCHAKCGCPITRVYRTQEVVGNSVLLSYRTICVDSCMERGDDVIDVAASGVTLALPAEPIPGKTYRVLAAAGDVVVVDAAGNFVATVLDGSALDLVFASSVARWMTTCCSALPGGPRLEDLIGPASVAGLAGAIGPAGIEGLIGAIGPQGVAGLVGGVGPQGVAGLIGAIGLQGIAGLVGAIGPAGVAGLAGAIGPQGIAGLIGEQGLQGLAGTVGAQGVAGIAGEVGLTGPAGPGGILEFGYVYNASLETVAIGDDVDFDANGILTPGITHAPGSSVIELGPAGDYEVTWSVSGVEPNQFALVLNGAIIADSLYGSGAGTQLNEGRTIVRAPAGSTLSLRNNASAAAVTLQPLAGGTQANVNASIRILKVA